MLGFLRTTKISADISRNIMFMELVHSIVVAYSLSKKKMNFHMTTHAQHTKILNRSIVPVFVNVMNVQTFIFRSRNATNFANLGQFSTGKYLETPTLISRAIAPVLFSLNSVLARFRAIMRFIFSKDPCLVNLATMLAGKINMWFSARNPKAFFRTEKIASSYTRFATGFARTITFHSDNSINKGGNVCHSF
jgi:hypothetical protein